jgi:hypothetical protein
MRRNIGFPAGDKGAREGISLLDYFCQLALEPEALCG